MGQYLTFGRPLAPATCLQLRLACFWCIYLGLIAIKGVLQISYAKSGNFCCVFRSTV